MQASSAKRWLWVLWTISTVVSSATVVLALITFAELAGVKGETDLTGVPGSQLDAALAGTLLSAILLIVLVLVSFIVLLRKTTWASRTGGGASLVLIAVSFYHCGLFVMLTGFTLTANSHWTTQFEQGSWTSGDTSALTATYVMCFITTGVYVILFVALLLLHRGLKASMPSPEEIVMASGLRTPSQAMSHDRETATTVIQTNQRPDSAPPSDYVNSVAAARQSYGAWKS